MLDPKLYFAIQSISNLKLIALEEMREKQRQNVAGIAVSLGYSSEYVESVLKDLPIQSAVHLSKKARS